MLYVVSNNITKKHLILILLMPKIERSAKFSNQKKLRNHQLTFKAL